MKLSLVAVAAASLALLGVLQVPSGEPERRGDAFVRVTEAGGLMGEQGDLLDPAALFLPGPANYGERLLDAVRPAAGRELFGAYAGGPLVGEGGLGRLAGPGFPIPDLAALTAAPDGFHLAGAGRVPLARAESPGIRVRLMRMDGPGERALQLPAGEADGAAGARYARFLVRVEAGRPVGTPLLVEGGGDAAQDAAARAWVAEATRSAHPLASGLWEVSLTW